MRGSPAETEVALDNHAAAQLSRKVLREELSLLRRSLSGQPFLRQDLPSIGKALQLECRMLNSHPSEFADSDVLFSCRA